MTRPSPPRLGQGRLFRKYLLLILTLVSGALLVSGGISLYFSYQEQKTALGDLQHEKAIAAASRIEQYIRQIEQQLAFAALPQLDAGDVELRRIEFLKLLRQVPEVTDIAQLDGDGREQVLVSRLGMDVMRSNRDRSDEPAFRFAKRGKPWIGPVYFRKETEPYMTISIRSGADNGPVTIADVNLKFIWDVVSRIRIGEKGKAYVVDGNGFLVADPDIGLVLRKTSMSDLPHVRAALDHQAQEEQADVSRDLAGTEVLTSNARIDSLNWIVFAEQPLAEATARLYKSVLQTALLLLAGLVISALCALALARGMVRPIRTLADGAQRIGEGELDQTIVVRTGDELEGLADRFNRMTTQLRESYAGLERKVEERTRELQSSLDQQTATAEVLKTISRTTFELQPVLETLIENATTLCRSDKGGIYLRSGEVYELVAAYGAEGSQIEFMKQHPVIPGQGSVVGMVARTGQVVHIEDAQSDPAYTWHEAQQIFGFRSIFGVPMVREGEPVGAFVMWRKEVRPFSTRERALVATFADQAVIAIQNVRLLSETKEALDQQTATAEVVKAISRATFDLRSVLEILIENACRVSRARKGFVLVPEGNAYAISVNRGATIEEVQFMLGRYRLSVDNGTNVPAKFLLTESDQTRGVLEGHTVLVDRVLQVPDVQASSLTAGYQGPQVDLRTMLCVPMLVEGTPIGVLSVWRNEVAPFSEREIELLRTFADQAVIAIQNARLVGEIQQKSRELEVANKHKSAFLASMSHELRTPLNAIIGFSEVLLARFFGELNDKQDDYLKDIHSSGRHLLNLINDVLDLSKVEAGRMDLEVSRFDLPSALSDAMTLIRERAMKHGIELGLEVEPGLGEVDADERKFKQILLNLLSNAVKFTPDGGRVDVKAARVDGAVQIAVSDTGIGIAPQDREAVFEEFRQAGGDYTSKQEGTGLGLALTRRFVELHGGRIWLASEVGKGSTFYFTIPDQAAHAAASVGVHTT